MTLPPTLAQAVRDAARAEVELALRTYAVGRGEVLELVAGLMPPLGSAELDALAVLLPWLATHRPRTWVLASEIVALALHHDVAGSSAVRAALAPMLAARDPSKALGRLLARCAWRPAAGHYLRRLAPKHRRESALFCVETAG